MIIRQKSYANVDLAGCGRRINSDEASLVKAKYIGSCIRIADNVINRNDEWGEREGGGEYTGITFGLINGVHLRPHDGREKSAAVVAMQDWIRIDVASARQVLYAQDERDKKGWGYAFTPLIFTMYTVAGARVETFRLPKLHGYFFVRACWVYIVRGYGRKGA